MATTRTSTSRPNLRSSDDGNTGLRTVQFEIYRYDPDQDTHPACQSCR